MLISIVTALMISVFNAISAFIIARVAYKKDNANFNKLIFGSMATRYFLTMFLVFICLKYMNLEKLSFGLTFLISTFILLLSEILYLNFRSNFVNLKTREKK